MGMSRNIRIGGADSRHGARANGKPAGVSGRLSVPGRLLTPEQTFQDRPAATMHVSKTGACGRCGGLMIAIEMNQLTLEREWGDPVGRRCVLCGDILDSVILKHRDYQQTSVRGRR
jgi:hypothetical protein